MLIVYKSIFYKYDNKKINLDISYIIYNINFL